MRTLLRFVLFLFLFLVMASAHELFGQTYGLVPWPVMQFFDNNGTVMNAGKVCTYATGTSTPRVTFSDNAGTANTNPVILNASGRATIYVDTALSYRFQVRTAGTDTTCATGTVIYTQDGVGWATTGSFTITNNVIPRGTGVSNGLADSGFTDDGTTISTSRAISITGATTLRGTTVTNGTFTAQGTVTLGTVTVTSCSGCGSTLTRYIPFADDAIRISGSPVTIFAGTTNMVVINLPSLADSEISAQFRVPPDAAVANPLTLTMNYLLSEAPGPTVNIVRLVTQATVINTSAAATAGDSITLANSNLPATYTATSNIVAASSYATGNLVRMSIRRDTSVANDCACDFYILNLGWTYTSSQ